MIDFIKRVFGLIVPYWKTKSSILSWVLLISVLFLTAGVVYLNKLFNNFCKFRISCKNFLRMIRVFSLHF